MASGYRAKGLPPAGRERQGRLGVGEDGAATTRLIYRMSGKEGKSWQAIADFLTNTGVPTGSPPTPLPGKRARRAAKIWRPGHLRNLLVNPTCRGEHHYGKRSSSRSREVIVRAVSAIVLAELWGRPRRRSKRTG